MSRQAAPNRFRTTEDLAISARTRAGIEQDGDGEDWLGEEVGSLGAAGLQGAAPAKGIRREFLYVCPEGLGVGKGWTLRRRRLR